MIAEVEEADYEITNVQGYSIKRLDVGTFRCIVPKGNTYNFVVTFLGESKNVEVVVSDDELDLEAIFDFDPETGAIALKNAKNFVFAYTDHLTGNGEAAKLSTIVIPNEINGVTVKRIGINRLHVGKDKNTYYTQGINSTYVEKIVLPDTIEEIDEEAFYGCTNLTDITIKSGVTSIGRSAFSGCSSLTNIIIPDTVTSIGSSAFWGCSSLTNITIPNGVSVIDYNTFYNCNSLANITIPNTVTSIGSSAFWGCSSLTNITIPNGVSIIDSDTFHTCNSLTNITIPNTVTSIGGSAFSECNSLTNITIPNSVKTIDTGAFYKCESLTDIYYKGTEEQWKDIDFKDRNDASLKNITIHYNQ